MESFLFFCCKNPTKIETRHQSHASMVKSIAQTYPTRPSQLMSLVSESQKLSQRSQSFFLDLPSNIDTSFTQEIIDKIRWTQNVQCEDQELTYRTLSIKDINTQASTNHRSQQQKFRKCNKNIKRVKKVAGISIKQLFS